MAICGMTFAPDESKLPPPTPLSPEHTSKISKIYKPPAANTIGSILISTDGLHVPEMVIRADNGSGGGGEGGGGEGGGGEGGGARVVVARVVVARVESLAWVSGMA